MSSLGPTEFLVVIFGLVPLVICIWGIADAASRPDFAWRAAGQKKVLWVALQVGGLLVCFLGVILSIVYLATIRPQLRAVQA